MNYIKNQNLASIFFLMFISQYGYADDISEQALPTVTVKQKRLTRSDNLLKGRKTSDHVIKGEQFRSRGSTIGEASTRNWAFTPIRLGLERVRRLFAVRKVNAFACCTITPKQAICPICRPTTP